MFFKLDEFYVDELKLINLMSMNFKWINLMTMNFKLTNLKWFVFLVLFSAF